MSTADADGRGDRLFVAVPLDDAVRDGLVAHLRASLGADYLTSMQDFYSPTTTYPGIVRGGFGSRGSLQTTTGPAAKRLAKPCQNCS